MVTIFQTMSIIAGICVLVTLGITTVTVVSERDRRSAKLLIANWLLFMLVAYSTWRGQMQVLGFKLSPMLLFAGLCFALTQLVFSMSKTLRGARDHKGENADG